MKMHTTQAADGTYPRFAHDCSACRYLGQFGESDLYFCKGSFESSVIARRSSDGPDYSSGMPFAYGSIPALTEARRRAQKLDLCQYSIKEAVAYANAERMDEATREELRVNLQASEMGKAVHALAMSAADGPQLVEAFLSREADAYKAKFPERDMEELRGWARSHLHHAWEWSHRLGLPVMPQAQFIMALHAGPTTANI